MGTFIKESFSYHEYSKTGELAEMPQQVLHLAERSLHPMLQSGLLSRKPSHVIVATSCPDMISPSLGQMIAEKYHSIFSESHIIDMVQGCAGGVSAMILASQLASLNCSEVLVINADAARKATSHTSRIHRNFGNGSFACLFSNDDSARGLLHYKSRQYKGLSEVVTVNLGHDADQIIYSNPGVKTNARKYLGLSMKQSLAIRLFRNAEAFYLEFIKEAEVPHIMVLHQVNPLIVKHLQSVFEKHKVEFVNVAEITGNCGSATVGIAFDLIKERTKGKRVFLCSFGTGGVITAGLWQN